MGGRGSPFLEILYPSEEWFLDQQSWIAPFFKSTIELRRYVTITRRSLRKITCQLMSAGGFPGTHASRAPIKFKCVKFCSNTLWACWNLDDK